MIKHLKQDTEASQGQAHERFWEGIVASPFIQGLPGCGS